MKRLALIWAIMSIFSVVSLANPAEQQQKKEAETESVAKNPVVKVITSMGEIQIELFADKAPVTVENFLSYINDGSYNGKIFHRVIPGFMIQGGGLTPDMKLKKSKAPIKNESYNKLRNVRGTIAMARKNPPDSATNQFFINHKDNRALDFDGAYKPGYAVFGKVIKGMDVVDKIAQVKTTNSQYFDEELGLNIPAQNVPVETVVIQSVTLIEDKKPEPKPEEKPEPEAEPESKPQPKTEPNEVE